MSAVEGGNHVCYEVHNAQIGQYQGRMIFTSNGPVPVTLFNSASTRGRWVSREEIGAFLSGCEIFLQKNRPDLVWTYGGDPVSILLHLLARRMGIPILFALHNFAYRDARIFGAEDHVIVPTEFARQFYRQSIGLEAIGSIKQLAGPVYQGCALRRMIPRPFRAHNARRAEGPED